MSCMGKVSHSTYTAHNFQLIWVEQYKANRKNETLVANEGPEINVPLRHFLHRRIVSWIQRKMIVDIFLHFRQVIFYPV